MSKGTRRARRVYSEEYKAEAVALVVSSGKSVCQVAKDLDLTETALRRWYDRARKKPTETTIGAESEQAELRRLREENRVLRMERDFQKKRRPSSRRRASEVCSHRSGEGRLSDHVHVPAVECLAQRLLRLALPETIEPSGRHRK